MRRFATVVLIPFIGVAWCLVLWLFLSTRPAAPPEQQHRAAATSSAATERTRQLCDAMAGCRRYAIARRACATQAAPADCVAARMRGIAADLAQCTDEGELRDPPQELPTPLACLMSRAIDAPATRPPQQ